MESTTALENLHRRAAGAMGRPSRLDVTVDHGQVELAGSCVVAAEGVLHL